MVPVNGTRVGRGEERKRSEGSFELERHRNSCFFVINRR
jgi:hypothetical protein